MTVCCSVGPRHFCLNRGGVIFLSLCGGVIKHVDEIARARRSGKRVSGSPQQPEPRLSGCEESIAAVQAHVLASDCVAMPAVPNDRTPMRNRLLATTAAMLVGMTLAAAQNMPRGGAQSERSPAGAQRRQ